MQFILTAYDGTDKEAPARRLAVRQGHLDKIAQLKKSGEFLFGGAILSEAGEMIGSMIVYEFYDRQTLDDKLKDEPYITEGVWQDIDIQPFRVARIE